MAETPAHLRPEACYVCGAAENQHTATTRHTFWSNADADKDFAAEPQGNSDAEARYVEEYRPY